MEQDTHPKAALNAPLNAFNIYPGLATPQAAIDFTPNNDTVYGLAWLDLRQGPVLMTVPEVKGRYCGPKRYGDFINFMSRTRNSLTL